MVGETRILVVDDDPLIRRVCRRILHMQGFRVEEAEGNSEAQAALDKNGSPVDVLVTDLRLRDGDGATLAAHTRRKHPSTGIVFITGDPEGAQSAGLAGEIVGKPFGGDELLGAVRRAIVDAGLPA